MVLLCVLMLSEQYPRLQTRTISERQFRNGAESWEHDLGKIRGFESRHGLKPETRNGLRIAINEWPDWTYLVSIESLKGGAARGAIHAVAYDGSGPSYERNFQLVPGEATLFFRSFDREIKGYWGDASICTDGTGLQFERWDKGQVSSGSGNAACHRHYAELMSIIAEPLIVQLKDAPFRAFSTAPESRKIPSARKF